MAKKPKKKRAKDEWSDLLRRETDRDTNVDPEFDGDGSDIVRRIKERGSLE